MSRRGGHQEAEKENHERWVISYADLVTLLLGFFIIMYATSKVDAEKFKVFSSGLSEAFNVPVREGAPSGSPILDGGLGVAPGGLDSRQLQRDYEEIRRDVLREAEKAGTGNMQVRVEREPDRVVIRLTNNLVFNSASAEIRPEARPALDAAAAALTRLPNQISIEGHTDNVPVGTERYPTNWELSSARATAVLRYLTERAGLDPRRAMAAGYGEYRPLASNDTPEGRALNRRADIVVLYAGAPGVPQQSAPTAGQPAVTQGGQ